VKVRGNIGIDRASGAPGFIGNGVGWARAGRVGLWSRSYTPGGSYDVLKARCVLYKGNECGLGEAAWLGRVATGVAWETYQWSLSNRSI
jgi:hypothetical protein